MISMSDKGMSVTLTGLDANGQALMLQGIIDAVPTATSFSVNYFDLDDEDEDQITGDESLVVKEDTLQTAAWLLRERLDTGLTEAQEIINTLVNGGYFIREIG